MSNEEEPKIIIDEGWKAQVEREREELKAQKATGEESGNESEAATEASDAAAQAPPTDVDSGPNKSDAPETSSTEEDMDAGPLPEASFSFLVTSLATQAVMAMGQMPGPDGQPAKPNLNHAKHFIDTLGVLEEKTQGNLDEDETKFLSETLHQIRMMFVAVSQQQ
ncbi:MAG: DUF1844 domain-containing protein [Planctomycetota bacterium]